MNVDFLGCLAAAWEVFFCLKRYILAWRIV